MQEFVTSKQLDIKLVSCQVAMNFQVLCRIGARCFFQTKFGIMAQVLAKVNLLVKSLRDFIENSIGLLIYNMESSFELCRCQTLSLMNEWVKIINLCGCRVGSKGF